MAHELHGNEEKLLHLYWECPHSRRLWERLKEMVHQGLGLTIQMSPAACLLGISHNSIPPQSTGKESTILLSTLCLLTKHFIHKCKCNTIMRTTEGLERYLKEIYAIEKQIATDRGIQHKLSNKWGQLKDQLNL